jgi:hypothetical protein
MSEATRKKVVFGLLVAAMVWGAYNIDFGQKRPGDRAGLPAAPAGPAVTAARPAPGINAARDESRDWGQDPFRVVLPERRRPQPAVTWNLGGIIYNSSAPLAIINNQTVGIGDVIGGATVVHIDKTKVTLDHNGSSVTLRVTPRG